MKEEEEGTREVFRSETVRESDTRLEKFHLVKSDGTPHHELRRRSNSGRVGWRDMWNARTRGEMRGECCVQG